MDAMWTLLDTADTTYPQYFLDLDLPNSWPSNTGSVAEHMFSESPFSSISDVQSSLESIVSQQEDMDTASVLRSLNEQETATAFQTYFENNS
ncbi:MAG: hypothetical protein U9Q15_04025 [Patescibacteria group bacterium]|nr:hypothetical protein [Patescibacteria group bacterium]